MYDVPLKELKEQAEKLLSEDSGAKIYFKFTCHHCGERCIFNEPNTYYEEGECCTCGGITPFTAGGMEVLFPTNFSQN